MENLSGNDRKSIRCIECGGQMRLQEINGFMQAETAVDILICEGCGEIVIPSISAKILEAALEGRPLAHG